LELGCGSGANIPFFKSLTENYFGIDGSVTIINKLHKKFPELSKNIIEGDFTKEIKFDRKFDLIVDRASLACNDIFSIKNCVNLIHEKLKPNGLFIGLDLYSTKSSEFLRGEKDEDEYTRRNFLDGPHAYSGRVHFFNYEQFNEIFHKFKIIKLEHKIIETAVPDENYIFATWSLVAQR